MPNDELYPLRLAGPECGEHSDITAFLDFWGRDILGMAMAPLGGQPLDASLLLRSLPGFEAAPDAPPPKHRHHVGAMIDDDEVIVVVRKGADERCQHGHTVMIAVGQAALKSNGTPATFNGLTATHVVNFRLSRNLLEPHIANLDGLVARPIPNEGRIRQMLPGFASMLKTPAELATPQLRQTVARQMHDLAALLLGAGDPSPQGLGIRAARLRAIKDEIMARIGQHGLAIGDIVRSQQISESYIRQLLAEDGTTFTDLVLDERLARAHRMLTDPRYQPFLIGAIAYEAGFGDLSYFNRTFRRRYDASPSHVRKAALGAAS